MFFKVDSRVRFIHTGDEGIVRKLLEDSMILVYLESIQMEIPVFYKDLELVEVKEKVAITEEESKDFIEESLETRMSSRLGIQLAFDPVLKKDGSPEKYDIYLINDTSFDVLYTIDFYLNDEKEETWSGTIAENWQIKLDELFYDELNDFPIFEVTCSKVSTEGQENELFKVLKIKPKIFFKNVKNVPSLDKKVHWFSLFENLEKTVIKKEVSTENLLDYAKNNSRPIQKYQVNRRKYNYTSPIEYAAFKAEIDLHIHNLASNFGKMTPAQIMQLQLQKFEEFIAKAVRLGVPQVFVIHGLGKGRLKEEIHKRLKSNSYVVNFKNEHHPKYGWGATEVNF